MLAETRTELDEFHASSKELEEELERELERTEKAQQDLKVKVARAEQERDEWKVRCPTSTTICALLMVITVQIHVVADDAQYNNDVVTA